MNIGAVSPRILFDLSTSLVWRNKHAVGITRTEREIASRLLRDFSLDIIPVVFHDGGLRAIEPEVALSIVAPVKSTQPLSAMSSAGWTLDTLEAIQHWIIGALGTIARAVRSLVRTAPLRHLLRAVAPRAVSLPALPKKAIDFSLVVHPCHRDVLFLCGLGWDVVDCRTIARLRSATGLRVVTVLYDLIPILHPEFLGGDPKDYYMNYFLHMVDMSDHVLCISECTRRDFVAFCAAENRAAPATSVLHLGANVPSAPDATEIRALGLTERFLRERYALSVGTFEIRKNYSLLIDLWHELATDPAFDLNLVIVGAPGWRVKDVIARLEASPLYGKRIFWLRNISDAGLSWLYENCQALLYPSLYEGWGLPVVEALQHKRPSIISSCGAVPEAGMGVATIIDPADRDGWKDAIVRIAGEPRTTLDFNIKLPTWDQATENVKRVILSLPSIGAVA